MNAKQKQILTKVARLLALHGSYLESIVREAKPDDLGDLTRIKRLIVEHEKMLTKMAEGLALAEGAGAVLSRVEERREAGVRASIGR